MSYDELIIFLLVNYSDYCVALATFMVSVLESEMKDTQQ